MKIAVALLHIIFLLYISYRLWRNEQSSLRSFFWPALIFKLTAGICVGLVYSYYYSAGDTFHYFSDGVKIAQLAKIDLLSFLNFLWSSEISTPILNDLIYKQPRAMFLSKFTSVFCLLTMNNYWVISLYFSTICFVCTWSLVKKIISMCSAAIDSVVISFLFFPTAVFWSSGIMKETLAVASLFFLSVIFLKIWKHENVLLFEWIFGFFSLWVLWNLKYYYLAVFLPVVITTLAFQFLVRRITIARLFLKIILWLVIFTLPLLAISILHPNFYLERFIDVIVSSYSQFESISSPGDLIRYNSLEPTFFSVLQNAPTALFSGLFRPFVTEATTIFQFLAALENLLLTILFIFALVNIKKIIASRHRVLLFSIFIYTVLLCTFLALSAPNFGTLSRYRVGFLPFFAMLLTIESPMINKIMTSKLLRNVVR